MKLFEKTAGGWYRAHNAVVAADVSVGPDSSFWFGAVARGDVASIRIGRKVNVQDGAVVHVDSGVPLEIGDNVTIGHRAIVHNQSIGDGTLIGMGAIVLGGVRLGRECFVAAGAVAPPGLQVPDGMMVMGVPGKIVRPVRPEELKYMRWLADHYVTLAARYAAGEWDGGRNSLEAPPAS